MKLKIWQNNFTISHNRFNISVTVNNYLFK